MIIILLILLIIFYYSSVKENFVNNNLHHIHNNKFYLNYSDNPYSGQKYNGILKINKKQNFIFTKINNYYQISPQDKPHLLLAIRTENGISQFNRYTTFINKNNLNMENPIHRNRYRSSLWKIIRYGKKNFYIIYNKRFPDMFIYNSDKTDFNLKCKIDGIVKFSNNPKKITYWQISPQI
jgi:hypothetical protein